MKRLAAWLCVAGMILGRSQAATPIEVTVGAPHGAQIASTFTGLSFGMRALLPDAAGAHFFSPTNTRLITLFKNIGLHHLRVGGTTVEAPPETPIPNQADIDSFFGFVKAAGVSKVIYSLRLLETNASLDYATTNAAIAGYIWSHYRDSLECFAIGNEPDLHRVFKQDYAITNYDSYLQKWKRFAATIHAAVPEATFAGPDAGSGNINWTTRFTRDSKDSAVRLVTEHFYAGGAGRNVTPEEGIRSMLSADWLKSYERLYEKVSEPVMKEGLSFRFTEANDHYTGGVAGASHTFAGALWALDFLHWWATHGVAGVDFHNTMWVHSDVITQNGFNPKAYGLLAFGLGSKGRSCPVLLSNKHEANFTVYAVRDGDTLLVTSLNKSHGAAETFYIKGIEPASKAELLRLTAPGGGPSAQMNITLGGASISSSEPWSGRWELADVHNVVVPPDSAAILKINIP